ncbi:MAG: hypothetical protein ABII76_21660 [Pseudomonadota bacterium]|jgi:hypothetical protein
MVDFSRLVLGPAMRVFSRAVVFKPAAGGEHQVRGIFDRAYVQVPSDDGSVQESVAPRLGIRIDEWPVMPLQKDRIVIGTETFMVVFAEPDGQGGATVVLRKVAG